VSRLFRCSRVPAGRGHRGRLLPDAHRVGPAARPRIPRPRSVPAAHDVERGCPARTSQRGLVAVLRDDLLPAVHRPVMRPGAQAQQLVRAGFAAAAAAIAACTQTTWSATWPPLGSSPSSPTWLSWPAGPSRWVKRGCRGCSRRRPRRWWDRAARFQRQLDHAVEDCPSWP